MCGVFLNDILCRVLALFYHRHRRSDLPRAEEDIVGMDGSEDILLCALRRVAHDRCERLPGTDTQNL